MRTGRKEYSYYRCPGRRDHTCAAPNVYVKDADQAVIDHVADGVSTDELVVLAREELRGMRHVPDEALSLQRQRLETAITRLGDRYQWQEIDEPEYRAERARLQAQLAELPPPIDSNILASDRTGEQLLPIATIIRETTPEHQAALIKHIVERVTVTDGEVTGIELRPEARPLYAGLVMAPPDGRGALTAKPEEKLAAYL